MAAVASGGEEKGSGRGCDQEGCGWKEAVAAGSALRWWCRIHLHRLRAAYSNERKKATRETSPPSSINISLRDLLKIPWLSCNRKLLLFPFFCTMFTPSFAPGASPQILTWHPAQSSLSSFWQSEDVHEHLRKLKETVGLAKALKTELEEILRVRRSRSPNSEGVSLSLDCPSARELSPSLSDSIATGVSRCFEDESILPFLKLIESKRISLDVQESLSMEAANTLLSTLKYQLVPLNGITSQAIPWEEKSVVVKFANKLQKSKRNKLWKKRKRKRDAELASKLREDYDKADQDADEWRAREIAKDMARRKVESMKEIAKLKSREERKKLESELELFLVVEKLQELRSIRIQKLKKQGHFIPEEDDKFLERVRAAVEEEERQAAAAADTLAAKDAIATAEESRKVMQNTITEAISIDEIEAPGWGSGYDSVSNLPFEFLHYFYGSSNDMGTLIEVRRTWDAYIRPGGSVAFEKGAVVVLEGLVPDVDVPTWRTLH
ncbi:hypothetical protein OPV22_032743 [Ensete ventricosum]|uniref:Uncharacterized protein n=1 Tax=Ensete ventricosum TaxID=4639 RepID=A0AAV8PW94_ENSVE|nr:hypothetical protein OPV22_032743 [Ensete ventricosum]